MVKTTQLAVRRGKRQIVRGVLLVLSLLLCLATSQIASAEENFIKIGVCGPMKFPAGEHMWIGAELAAEEINSDGGVLINGKAYKVKLFKADSNEYLSITDAVTALDRLLSVDKVDFVIGGARSEAILAQMSVMADNKKVYIMSGGGSPRLTMQVAKDYDKYKYFFRTTTPHVGFQIKALSAALDTVAKKIRNDLGIAKPKVALVMEKIVAVDAMIKVAKAVLPKMDMEIVGTWRPSPTANDLTAELSAVKSSGAQIIFTCFTGPVGVVFGKQWGELEVPAAAVGVNVEAQLKKYWKATEGYCQYEMILNPVVRAKVTGKTLPAFDKYTQKTGDYPLYTGMGAWDAVYLLTQAAKKARSLNSDAVVKALEETDYLGVAGRMQYYPKGHPLTHDLKFGAMHSTLFCQQWIKGALVTVWPDGKAPHASIKAGPGWEAVKFDGTVDYVLPPVVVKYWKDKKK